MQRSNLHIIYPITEAELAFIESVTQFAEKYLPRRQTIHHFNLLRAFRSEIKSCLTHPHLITISELCELFSAMRNIDRIHLLNCRPTLIKKVYRLAILLKDIPDDNDRLLLACSQIEKLYHPNPAEIGKRIIMIAAPLPQQHQIAFCKMAITAMLHRQQQLKQNVSITASFLFSALTCVSYIARSTPPLTAIALIGAIASIAKDFPPTEENDRLNYDLLYNFSMWKSSLPASSKRDQTNTQHQQSSPRL